MFWQGIDPIAAVRVLGDAIFHVHAKDTQIYSANLPKTGVLDTKPYLYRREEPQLDFPHLRLWSRRGVVERICLHAADVWL
jgi:sugar phosphate isomerase/epimerase